MVGIVATLSRPGRLGLYAYVVSFIELFIAPVDMGMNQIPVREISRDMGSDRPADQLDLTCARCSRWIVMVIVGVLAAQTGDPGAVAGGYESTMSPSVVFPDGRRVWLGVSGLPADGVPVLGYQPRSGVAAGPDVAGGVAQSGDWWRCLACG